MDNWAINKPQVKKVKSVLLKNTFAFMYMLLFVDQMSICVPIKRYTKLIK